MCVYEVEILSRILCNAFWPHPTSAPTPRAPSRVPACSPTCDRPRVLQPGVHLVHLLRVHACWPLCGHVRKCRAAWASIFICALSRELLPRVGVFGAERDSEEPSRVTSLNAAENGCCTATQSKSRFTSYTQSGSGWHTVLNLACADQQTARQGCPRQCPLTTPLARMQHHSPAALDTTLVSYPD